jgi:cell division protein FtsQ
LHYRLQRLWLTPLFRVAFRVGLPAFVLALAVGLYLSNDSRRSAILAQIDAVKSSFEDRPEFRVSLISITGAAPDLADAVRARMGIRLPLSSWRLDLDAARTSAEALDAVESARLRIKGSELVVEITERTPALVWRTDKGLAMVDATGHRVAGLASREDRPDLPLVAGDGADQAAPEALEILQAAASLSPRIRGLIRQGDRRWDMVLDRDQVIELPAIDPVSAVERLLALDLADNLLARDLTAVDLRDPRRPVLRLGTHALATLRGTPDPVADAVAPVADTTASPAATTHAATAKPAAKLAANPAKPTKPAKSATATTAASAFPTTANARISP